MGQQGLDCKTATANGRGEGRFSLIGCTTAEGVNSLPRCVGVHQQAEHVEDVQDVEQQHHQGKAVRVLHVRALRRGGRRCRTCRRCSRLGAVQGWMQLGCPSVTAWAAEATNWAVGWWAAHGRAAQGRREWRHASGRRAGTPTLPPPAGELRAQEGSSG